MFCKTQSSQKQPIAKEKNKMLSFAFPAFYCVYIEFWFVVVSVMCS